MKERCRDGCRTSLLIAGVVLVPAIFHTLLPPCHPYITIHFMEIIFSTFPGQCHTVISNLAITRIILNPFYNAAVYTAYSEPTMHCIHVVYILSRAMPYRKPSTRFQINATHDISQKFTTCV